MKSRFAYIAIFSIYIILLNNFKVNAYPSLVTNGLIANYDTSNPSSYTSGNTIYDLKYNNNLTFGSGTGSPDTLTTPSGTAVNISGGSYLSMSGNMLDSFTAGFSDSIFLWVYPQGDGTILEERSRDSNWKDIGWHDSQIELVGTTLYFRQWMLASPYESTTISLNKWMYIGITYDSSTQTLKSYVNGNPVASTSSFSRLTPSPSLIYDVGHGDSATFMNTSANGNFKFAGMHIYNRALTTTEIKQNFLATQTRFTYTAPTNVSAISTLASQGRTSFTGVSGSPSGYVANIFTDAAGTNLLETSSVSASGTTFSGLSPNTTYYLSVYALGDQASTFNSPESNLVAFTTPKNVSTISVTFGTGTTSSKKNITTKLTATFNTSGTITFYFNGKVINKCNNLFSNSGSVDCSWKPLVHGQTYVTASFTPTDSNNWSNATSSNFIVNTGKRTTSR